PGDVAVAEGVVYVGDGARRYRDVLEARGGVVPADGDERHLPRARFHAALAGPAGAVDVRRRAGEAELDLPRRVRPRRRDRPARRLPDRVALRRRVARDERRRRPGASRPRDRDDAARAALRADRRRRAPRLHARGARLERDRDRSLRAARLPGARHPPRLLHRQPRRRADHVEGPRRPRPELTGTMSRPHSLILGIETSCDETAAALVTHDGTIAASVVSSQADLHARYGGVVPE